MLHILDLTSRGIIAQRDWYQNGESSNLWVRVCVELSSLNRAQHVYFHSHHLIVNSARMYMVSVDWMPRESISNVVSLALHHRVWLV